MGAFVHPSECAPAEFIVPSSGIPLLPAAHESVRFVLICFVFEFAEDREAFLGRRQGDTRR